MPWQALPHKDQQIVNLSKEFAVRGVPRLIILNQQGEVLHENAVQKITSEGPDAIQAFIQGKNFTQQKTVQKNVEP